MARDNVRTQLLTLGAGVFAAGALVYTARNFALSRGTLEETRRSVELTRHTVELTEQGQVTDRYAKAIEQLGSDNLEVRIGAIYALERIARDSARDQTTVMEVLVVFARDHSHEQWPEKKHDSGEQERSIRPDVQAALTVIGRRCRRRDSQQDIPQEIDLSGAYLSGASLRRADLIHASLTGAYLTDVDLTEADLTEADLTGALLMGAHLTRTKLNQAFLTRVNFDRADLTGADLTGADLTGVDLAHAKNLTDATYTGADLTGVRWREGVSAPEGWAPNIRSGELEAAGTDSKPADAK